jgi:hypothetical protein
MLVGLKHGFGIALGVLTCFGVAATGYGAGAMAAPSTPVIGWVEVQPLPGGKDQVAIIGHAHALAALSGQYALSISRGSKGNTAKTRQGGKFTVGAGENATLSRTTINVGPAESLVIELTIVVDGKEVFSLTMKSSPVSTAKDI